MKDDTGRGPLEHDSAVGRLDDYLDGELAEDVRVGMEAHLASCATCRAELVRLRALVDRAGRLPRSIEPPRDLWPAIDARLEAGPTRRRIRPSRSVMAAAAVLLIAIASTLTVWVAEKPALKPGGPAGGTGEGPAGTAAVPAEWRLLEREYEAAAAELEERLEMVGGDLAPETRRIVEENLRVIDRAIAESRDALARDPANRELARMLGSTYERKLEVLRHAARL